VLPRGLRRGKVNFRSHKSCLSIGAPSPGRCRPCVLFGVFFRGGCSPTELPGDTIWLALPPTGWGGLSVLSHRPDLAVVLNRAAARRAASRVRRAGPGRCAADSCSIWTGRRSQHLPRDNTGPHGTAHPPERAQGSISDGDSSVELTSGIRLAQMGVDAVPYEARARLCGTSALRAVKCVPHGRPGRRPASSTRGSAPRREGGHLWSPWRAPTGRQL